MAASSSRPATMVADGNATGASTTSTSPYSIIEVANSHGGDYEYMMQLLGEFKDFGPGYGIKFQPLHHTTLATPDFPSYPVYESFVFSFQQWGTIFDEVRRTRKDIWLDIFDTYGVEVLGRHLGQVYGLKLQVGVLEHLHVLEALSRLDLSDKLLIMNVAALEVDAIRVLLARLENKLRPREILIQVGFQSFPTKFVDCGLGKLRTIKDSLQKRIVFADHENRDSEFALWLPAMALCCGADIVEKHVMHSSLNTKYDSVSALKVHEFTKMMDLTSQVNGVLHAKEFVNRREKEYYEKGLMRPLLAHGREKGSPLSLAHDLVFLRSLSKGLSFSEIEKLTTTGHVLSQSVAAGAPLRREYFKSATIGVLVACRLKSARCKRKAVRKLGDLTSIEQCLRNCCSMTRAHHVVLCTSTTEEDAELSGYRYNSSAVGFHQGDPEDVIWRYLEVVRQLKIDVIVRVTGDNPFVSPEMCDLLLESHFREGADYTAPREGAIGTGMEIVSARALEHIHAVTGGAQYSEYMTWYFVNNPDCFRLNFVPLPAELCRDYRLTLDYEEDYQMFCTLVEGLQREKKIDHTGDTRAVLAFLDEHPEVVSMNSQKVLKWATDKELIATLNEKTRLTAMLHPGPPRQAWQEADEEENNKKQANRQELLVQGQRVTG
ncbi:unnamed protein product [Amoebophrya sp. A120]|nr:unnamed protein product [Amoebophrya sp. A120]|eukprot:GSA120T00020611001.1